MMRTLCLAVLLWAGCKQAGEGADPEEVKTGVDTPKGSAGGFSAGLAADLAKADVGSAVKPVAGSAQAGSAIGDTSAGSGSAGSGSATDGSGSAVAVADTKPTTEEPGKPETGSGSGSAKVADTKPPEPPKAPVEMTAEMKAIKLSLGPNWARDVVGAGTLSLEVNVQSRDVKFTYKFNYGYDDPKAPTDREQYKKYLADSKQLTVSVDRQQGAAWYLEGTDSAGRTAWRVLVIYGGKRLVCGGSSYKENDLGDIRDDVVQQAKKICETISL
ncbi:MAG TPA: hypothetical protein VGM90_19705 [Kofleriaceae bacterium]|jgi:hypothetical protein